MSRYKLRSHSVDERGIAGAYLRDDGARFKAAVQGSRIGVLRELHDAHSGEHVVVHVQPGTEEFNTLAGLVRRLAAELSAAPEA